MPLSSFIGREREVAEVKRLLATTRLLTLTGAGGSGKTRLALRVAHDLAGAGAYPDGVGWTELADLTDPALVPQAVATSLAVQEQAGRPLLQTLLDHLRSRTILLSLDNCEHLLAACASLVDPLLRACPRLTILATSREPLRIEGETVWQVPPLSIPVAMQPEDRADEGLAAHTARYEAVQLFTARAAAVLPSFRLTDDNALLIADTCRRLDGLPLAIELAAAWTRFLSVADIASRLDHSLQWLTRGSPTAPLRQQTLRAAIDWSYTLLAPAEQTLLQRLAVFAGGLSLEAAETVCAGPDGAASVLDTLASLVDKSLVVVVPGEDGQGPTRYRLLETIRHYADEKLAASGLGPELHDRHLAWYLALAEGAVPELKGRAAGHWLKRLELEHDNLRAALNWSQTRGQWAAGLRLAAALHWFWERRGYFSEGRAWLRTLLAATATATLDGGLTGARANALLGAAALAFDQGDWAEAATYAEEGARLFRATDDRAGLTLALLRLGFAVGPATERGRQWQAEALALSATVEDRWTVAITRYVTGQGAFFRADYAEARPYLEDALRLIREVGDVLFLPRVLSTLGGVDLGLGEYSQARVRLEEALALVRATNDPRALALVAAMLGDVARCQGDYARAEATYQESLALHRRLGNQADVPALQHSLGYVALGQGDIAAAEALARASLLGQRDQGNLPGVAEGLAGQAAVAVARRQSERAARLFGAAEALREQVQRMVWPAERFEWRRHVAALRAQLDAATLATAWAAGRAMTVEQAIGYALADEALAAPASSTTTPPSPSRRQDEQAYYGGLTARERQIAALIAQGRTNRAIADELVIAERTVDRHVANMMAKLDCHSRAQIAAWAVEKGLATSH